MSKDYRVHVTRDYRKGNTLVYEEIEDDSDEQDEIGDHIVTIYESKNPFRVFLYEDSYYTFIIRELSAFAKLEDAENYCEQQYYLLNGAFPFIADGETEAYHPKGKRPKPEWYKNFDEENTRLHNMIERDSDMWQFLLIVDSEAEIATNHSLGWCDVW